MVFLKEFFEKVKKKKNQQTTRKYAMTSFLVPHQKRNYYVGVLVGDNTVKPVLSGHSKLDKTKVLKTNGSLMKVKGIAE